MKNVIASVVVLLSGLSLFAVECSLSVTKSGETSVQLLKSIPSSDNEVILALTLENVAAAYNANFNTQKEMLSIADANGNMTILEQKLGKTVNETSAPLLGLSANGAHYSLRCDKEK